MNNKLNRYKHMLTLLAILFLVVASGAQQSTTAVMTAMAANSKQLKGYTFKQRTEIYHKGELKNAKVEQVHFTSSGERISIPLEQQKTQTEPSRLRPGARLIAKRMEEKQGEMKDYVERLMAFTSRY